MSELIILAQAKREGFNSAIARAALSAFSEGSAQLIDLYTENFDPVMPAEELPRKFSFDETTLAYQEAVGKADRLIFVHPDWWGGPPAIMKGFIDRVFRPGIAYGFREADFKDADAPGLFSRKRADIFITTDASAPSSGLGQKLSTWAPAEVWQKSVMEFCGVLDARVHVFWELRNSTYAARKAWLDGVAALLA